MTVPPQSPTVQIRFVLQCLRDKGWVDLTAAADKAALLEGAKRLIDEGSVGGVRLMRLDTYVDHEFTERCIVFKRVLDGVVQADPLAHLVDEDGGPALVSVEDAYTEAGRALLRRHLARFLEERRLTLLEVLHSERHVHSLEMAGTTLQGALQKIAVAEAKRGSVPASRLFKGLMALMDQLAAELRAEAVASPVSAVAPGQFGAVCRSLDGSTLPEGRRAFRIFRLLSATLVPAKTRLDRFDVIGLLIEPDMPASHLRWLDTLLAEMVSAGAVPRELIGNDGRCQSLRALIGFHAGAADWVPDGAPAGLAQVAALIGQGRLPRTRAMLRRRILRDLYAWTSLVPQGSLMAELEAQGQILRHMRECASALVGDEEVHDILEQRTARNLSAGTVGACLHGASGMGDKVALVCRLITLAPGSANKSTILGQFRAAVSPDDFVWQCLREAKTRVAALKPLVEMQQLVAGLPFLDRNKLDFLAAVDDAILDVFKTDVMALANRSHQERVGALIRLCIALPLGNGKARTYASQTISRELRDIAFLPAYLERLKTDEERRDAAAKLRNFLSGTDPKTKPVASV